MLPYRDFFDHHTPWLHFILQWIFLIWGQDIPTIFIARKLMLVFTGGLLYVTYRLGKEIYSTDAGLLIVNSGTAGASWHLEASESGFDSEGDSQSNSSYAGAGPAIAEVFTMGVFWVLPIHTPTQTCGRHPIVHVSR